MGTNTSKSQSLTGKHQYFDQMIINPNNNSMICIVTVQSTNMLTIWASNLLKTKKIGPQTILLPHQFKEISSNYCGKYTQVQIEYDCYYMNFKDEILERKNQSCHFDQSSLWYLLLTLIQTAQACHQMRLKVGDIKPQNILLSNDGKAKIITQLSLPRNIDAYICYSQTTHSLLSPEQLQSLRKSYHQNKTNYILSESFSIGLLILLAGNLIDSSMIYDYKDRVINMIQFNRQLQFWQSFEFYDGGKEKQPVRYSSALRAIVTKMLALDSQKRLDSLCLLKILQRYKNKIMNLQPFQLPLDLLEKRQQYHQTDKIKGQKSTNIHNLRSSKQRHKQMNITSLLDIKTSKKNNQTFNQSFSFQNYQHTSFLSNQPPVYNSIQNSSGSYKQEQLHRFNAVGLSPNKEGGKVREQVLGEVRQKQTISSPSKKRKISTTSKNRT